MTIHERIKARRKECGLSAEDVAEKLGVSRATVYRYESAEIANMGIDKIEPLANALHTTPEYLMGWTDDPINYDDGDILAQIPLSYVEACEGDVEKAYAMMLAADQDSTSIQNTACDYAKNGYERDMLLLARHLEKIPEETRKRLIKNFADSIDMYFDVMGIEKEEGKN